MRIVNALTLGFGLFLLHCGASPSTASPELDPVDAGAAPIAAKSVALGAASAHAASRPLELAAASTSSDASCTCSGTGINGPVTVSCGQTTIGTDGQTYVCNAPGGPNNWSMCTCSGTGINGPVTVSCGQTTCGTDSNTYVCNAPGGSGGWALQSSGCGSPPPVCTCSGTGINGPVTVSCGQTTCGTDRNTYVCNAPGGPNGFSLQSPGCTCKPGSCTAQCGTTSDGCGGTIDCGPCPKTCTTPQACCVEEGGTWQGGRCF